MKPQSMALYDKVSGPRDAEQGNEFELPVQGTDLSRFQPMDIGGYDKYAVRYGRGSELAKPEDIEGCGEPGCGKLQLLNLLRNIT